MLFKCCVVLRALVMQRLYIGKMQEGTRKPISLLTQADIMTALHRFSYDLPAAEAWLISLQRHRESRYKIAVASTEKYVTQDSASGPVSRGVIPGMKISSKVIPKGQSSGSPTVSRRSGGGNRWEDWSGTDRAAFFTHLGNKVHRTYSISFSHTSQTALLYSFYPRSRLLLVDGSTKTWRKWWRRIRRRAKAILSSSTTTGSSMSHTTLAGKARNVRSTSCL